MKLIKDKAKVVETDIKALKEIKQGIKNAKIFESYAKNKYERDVNDLLSLITSKRAKKLKRDYVDAKYYENDKKQVGYNQK